MQTRESHSLRKKRGGERETDTKKRKAKVWVTFAAAASAGERKRKERPKCGERKRRKEVESGDESNKQEDDAAIMMMQATGREVCWLPNRFSFLPSRLSSSFFPSLVLQFHCHILHVAFSAMQSSQTFNFLPVTTSSRQNTCIS